MTDPRRPGFVTRLDRSLVAAARKRRDRRRRVRRAIAYTLLGCACVMLGSYAQSPVFQPWVYIALALAVAGALIHPKGVR